MQVFTVSFFGHRRLEYAADIQRQLERVLIDLMTNKEMVVFLVGRNGDFDIMVSSAIKQLQYRFGRRSVHTLVLPYATAELRDNEESFRRYYDDIMLFEGNGRTHYKAAITERNKYMVDCADMVVCCVQHEYGGAYNALKYARFSGKRIVNLCESDSFA